MKWRILLFLKWLFRSVSKRGLVRTCKVGSSALMDLSFDLWHGTETTKWVWVEDLGANSEHDANATGHRASKARPLRKLINRLDVPRECVFIDLGSGMGRALLLAVQLGFKTVVGVEFSPKLCAIARQNVKIFTQSDALSGQVTVTSRIEVIQADVARFEIPAERCIFYAFNPFDGVVMERFVGNLRDSLQRFPREIWFVYQNPLCASVIDKSELFSSAQDFEIGGAEFKVYKNF